MLLAIGTQEDGSRSGVKAKVPTYLKHLSLVSVSFGLQYSIENWSCNILYLIYQGGKTTYFTHWRSKAIGDVASNEFF